MPTAADPQTNTHTKKEKRTDNLTPLNQPIKTNDQTSKQHSIKNISFFCNALQSISALDQFAIKRAVHFFQVHSNQPSPLRDFLSSTDIMYMTGGAVKTSGIRVILKHFRQFVQSDWFLPVFISHDKRRSGLIHSNAGVYFHT